jgi:D-galactarolactone cycloisomerase
MIISSVTAIPLEASFAEAYGGVENVPLHLSAPSSQFQRIPRHGQVSTLVMVQSEDGATGYGEAFGLPHPLAATVLVNNIIAPFLTGMDLTEPRSMLDGILRYFAGFGSTRGPAMEAVSAVDIALWDLKARIAGVPLAELLGSTSGPVRTYVSPIAFRQRADESADAARGYVKDGFRAVKLKVGRGLAIDLEHVAAVREAIGTSVLLYLDANCAYDVPTAIRIAQALKPFDIAWFEEPVPPEDPLALAEVRRAAPMPIAAGENEFTLAGCKSLVDAGAIDVLQPNITRAGGVSGILEIGELCARSGISLALHGVGGCVAVGASLSVCRAVKGFHSFEANRLVNPLRDQLGVHPILFQDGCLVASDQPGHGGEPRPDLVARYRIDGADRCSAR